MAVGVKEKAASEHGEDDALGISRRVVMKVDQTVDATIIAFLSLLGSSRSGGNQTERPGLELKG